MARAVTREIVVPMIALLARDRIGPAVIAETRRMLDALKLALAFEMALVGDVAYEAVLARL